MSKKRQLLQKIFLKNPGKCKKVDVHFISENPLYKKIPPEKNYFYDEWF